MNRYTVIREKMAAGLQAKTGWGRNEVLTLLDSVLLATADEELTSLDKTTEPAGETYDDVWEDLHDNADPMF